MAGQGRPPKRCARAGLEAGALRELAAGQPDAAPLDADSLALLGIDLDQVRRAAEAAFGPGALDRPALAERAAATRARMTVGSPRTPWRSRCGLPRPAATGRSRPATCWPGSSTRGQRRPAAPDRRRSRSGRAARRHPAPDGRSRLTTFPYRPAPEPRRNRFNGAPAQAQAGRACRARRGGQGARSQHADGAPSRSTSRTLTVQSSRTRRRRRDRRRLGGHPGHDQRQHGGTGPGDDRGDARLPQRADQAAVAGIELAR